MKKLTFFSLLGILVVILSVGWWFSKQGFEETQTSSAQNVLSVQQESSSVASPTVVPTGVPRRLIIPKIGVNADVEVVGLDKDGNMDVPKNDENVAWYQPGYMLGEKGNTVMAGHLDTKTGAPAVFYDLEAIDIGDTVIAEDEQGREFIYTVKKIERYPYNNFPLQEVFGAYDVNRLNLITCQGTYDSAARIYSHRTVVFSELTSINN